MSNEIVLRNIQYIPQQIHIGVSHDGAIRHGTIMLMNSTEVANWETYKNNVIYNEVFKASNRYCGLASALMVRSKAQRYSTLARDDATAINNGLTDMAFGLSEGRYGGPDKYKVDVVESGLLYIRSDWWSKLYDQAAVSEQFYITQTVIENLYTAQSPLRDLHLDVTPIDRGHVTGLSMYCERIPNALNLIWNNINNEREPAIFVCDYNAVENIRNPQKSRDNLYVSPHYNVVVGVRKRNGLREFYVFDPWETLREFWYTEAQMEKLMEITNTYPFWIWQLPGFFGINSQPCYVGIVHNSTEGN